MISRLTARLPAFSFFSSVATPAQLQRNDIKDFVEKTIKDNQVVIFSKTWCQYCRSVKVLFKDNFPGLSPEIVELDEHEHGSGIQDYLAERTKQTTVPSVFINQEHIGGADDTKAAFQAGKLESLLSSTRQATSRL